jgi:hypothetical protein
LGARRRSGGGPAHPGGWVGDVGGGGQRVTAEGSSGAGGGGGASPQRRARGGGGRSKCELALGWADMVSMPWSSCLAGAWHGQRCLAGAWHGQRCLAGANLRSPTVGAVPPAVWQVTGSWAASLEAARRDQDKHALLDVRAEAAAALAKLYDRWAAGLHVGAGAWVSPPPLPPPPPAHAHGWSQAPPAASCPPQQTGSGAPCCPPCCAPTC